MMLECTIRPEGRKGPGVDDFAGPKSLTGPSRTHGLGAWDIKAGGAQAGGRGRSRAGAGGGGSGTRPPPGGATRGGPGGDGRCAGLRRRSLHHGLPRAPRPSRAPRRRRRVLPRRGKCSPRDPWTRGTPRGHVGDLAGAAPREPSAPASPCPPPRPTPFGFFLWLPPPLGLLRLPTGGCAGPRRGWIATPEAHLGTLGYAA